MKRFKSFNDHYGFKRGDEVIQRTAKLLLNAVRQHGNPKDFVGHIGGDDFIVITSADRAEPVGRAIVREFDEVAPQLHDAPDRARGSFRHVDRKGQAITVPLLSVAVVAVTNEEHPLTHPGQIATISAELKAYAKQFDRSTFLRERRQAPS